MSYKKRAKIDGASKISFLDTLQKEVLLIINNDDKKRREDAVDLIEWFLGKLIKLVGIKKRPTAVGLNFQ